ncbi:MAG: hypothetical protein SP1CHLAM9_12060 [Chlamydiia bacterium]|nr:hypothetical protein [Chlamydiia bacterium]
MSFSKLREEAQTLIKLCTEDGFAKAKKSNHDYATGNTSQAYYESEMSQVSLIAKFSNDGAILLGAIMPAVRDGGCVLYGTESVVKPDAVVLLQGRQKCMDTEYGGVEMPHDLFHVAEENRHYFDEKLKEDYADCKKDYFEGVAGSARIRKTIRFHVDQLRKGKKVFSHCSSGKDRSASLVLGSLIYLLGDNTDKTYMMALNFLLSKRTIVNCDFSLNIDPNDVAQQSFHRWYIAPIRAAVAEMIAEDALQLEIDKID